MNSKYFVLVFIFSITSLAAMIPQEGTVIDPLNHNGQFTITARPKNISSQKNISLPFELCKDKGIPVIISFAASAFPWWALTTGTGYLLISQCDCNNPLLISACASGASYAVAQKITESLKKVCPSRFFYYTTQAVCVVACMGLSYYSTANVIDDACLAACQAIGLQTCLDLSASLFPKKEIPQEQSSLNYSAYLNSTKS